MPFLKFGPKYKKPSHLNSHKKEKSIDETREFFEEIVNQFIGCSRYWKIYIEQELKSTIYNNNGDQGDCWGDKQSTKNYLGNKK